MRLGASAVGKLLGEVDESVEAERAILFDVNVKRLEIGRSVDDTDVAGLHKVVGNDDVLLVGSDLDVVGSDGRLVLFGVVEALDVVQVGDVEGGDVVGGGESDWYGLLVLSMLEEAQRSLQYANLPSDVISE